MTYSDTSSADLERLTLGLGWFSIALGTAELVAPGRMAHLIGAPDTDETRQTLRFFGAREVASGLAILAQPDRAGWLWSRVGGDAVDLAWLGRSARREESDAGRLGLAMAAVAGVTALDLFAAQRLQRRGDGPCEGERAVRVQEVVTINRGIDEVYAFWRDFGNLPRFMRHVASVEVLDERRSRWRATAPAGMTVEWEADIVQDRPNEWIAWRSVPDSGISNSGSVRFTHAPGARGTEVRVQLAYEPPAGSLGRGIAWLFGEEPSQQVREDLRRFKQILETGEVAVSDGPGLRRAARPAARAGQGRAYTEVHE